MKSMPATKYRPFPPVALADRRWPSRRIERAPRWCSVDLRDGNQALAEPMGPAQKRRLFDALVDLGFDEIEVAYPSSSEPERQFLRDLIETGAIPDPVTIQVLTPARLPLIDETFAALEGARRAIVHLHNPTSELQRRVVFKLDRREIVALAVESARQMQAWRERMPETELVFEYSPESFTGTELDFALEISEAVLDVWGPTPDRPVILNLPATVEMSTPNVYADQIEWFGRRLRDRDCVVLSVHPHNDRGTGVAAAELALLAGADRVEGTLFGNGERTGNVDLVTLALNLYSQGVDPGLAFWDVDALVKLSEELTQIPVHPRHPYAGELVYTAFSGAHQDAIRKGMAALAEAKSDQWEVPYLPIDPGDVGRSYDGLIRINSQSGKGGVSYVVERALGLRLPRTLAVAFSRQVQIDAESTGRELSPGWIVRRFEEAYLAPEPRIRVTDVDRSLEPAGEAPEHFRFRVRIDAELHALTGRGNGPIDAFAKALGAHLGIGIDVCDFAEHALQPGSDAEAAAFVELAFPHGARAHGVGRASGIVTAALDAFCRAVDAWRRAADPDPMT